MPQSPFPYAMLIRAPRASAALLGPLAVALAAVAGVARADNGPYVGVGATQTELDDIYGEDLHLHNSVPTFIAGVRFADYLGFELNYANLGSQDAALLGSYSIGYAHADAKQFSAYAMGYLPLPFVDLFAKAGLMRWQLASNAEVGGASLYSLDDNGTTFAWGLGGQLQFGPFAPRLEWVRSNVPFSGGLNLWTLGLTFTF
jgi:Outer membrane protein beta-barrel domain